MSGRGHLQFVPSLEALDERVNPSPVIASAEPDAVADHVRYHGFAIVDRTQEEAAGISKLGGRLLIIQGGGTYTGADDGVVILTSVLKGSTIRENAPAGTNETLTIGGPRTENDAFYGIGVYKSTGAGKGDSSNVIYVPTSNGGVWKTTNGESSGRGGNVYTVTFGGS